MGDSPFFVYKGKDPELPQTRFAKPKLSYKEAVTFEDERQQREYLVMEKVKEKLLESADRNCRRRAKHCKERTLKVDDRVFIRRIQKKGESKLIPKWQGPYRILNQKNPGVYKLKDLRTGKVTEQHIENISEKVFMARESEIPSEECPQARQPFPMLQEDDSKEPHHQKFVPEGAADDNYVDGSHVLVIPQGSDPNMFEPSPQDMNKNQETAPNTPRRSARLASKPLGLAPFWPEMLGA